jgi:uncharacterized protein (TIGR03492 family)
MGEERKILFVSNGYGEDNVAAHIARELHKRFPNFLVYAFPTVGGGKFYTENGVPLAGEGIMMPSEGFVRSPKDFVRDLRQGFIGETLRMGRRLRAAAGGNDFLVVTGDPYLLFYTSLFSKTGKSRRIFVGTLQSEWYGSKRPFKEHYSFLERLWLRWFCRLIITRDEKTAEYLKSHGLECAISYGNPMMDCLVIRQKRIFPKNRTVIGILPGSKREAYDNFGRIIEALKELVRRSGKENRYLFAVAVSPNLDVGELERRYGLSKVGLYPVDPAFTVYRIEESGIKLHISKSSFGNIINESDAVIGLSGTANEQAAGLGKPVFGFWGDGPQITKKFTVAQKRLLGISLFLFPPEPIKIAAKIDDVLDDKELLRKVEENGKHRMGGRGSVERIAQKIGIYIMRNMSV